MPHVIDLDYPNIDQALFEAALLAQERKPDLELDSFILGYRVAFELMLNAALEDRKKRR